MKNMMHEETPGNGEVTAPYRMQRHRTGRIVTFVILISLLVVLIVSGLGIGFRLLNPIPIRTTMETRAFHLSAGTRPTLIMSDDDGFVHIRPGADNAVTVTATKVGDSFAASPDDFKVSYSQSGNTITIQVNNNSIHPFDFLNSGQADLNVTVPVNSDLHLETGSGNISVTGIQGMMTLTSNSGTLQAMDVSLTRNSLLSTDSGDITVHGSIDTAGHFMFQSNSGNIDVTLPRYASFHADLVSNSGTITNDFPIATAQQPGTDGGTVKGDVGSSPQATVTMQSDSGDLHLRQT